MANNRNQLLGMLAAAVLTGTAAMPFLAHPAHADQSTNQDNTGRLQLVMDASGSMAEPTGDDAGTTRIEAAKSALNTLIDDLPDNAHVGLRVFGSEVFSSSDPGACEDSVQVVEPATDNRDNLRAAVADYEPYGETPIGYALQQAANDLGTETQRTIVLVSDGEPTCDPDPCEVAADLISRGYNMRIHVVGFDLDENARATMECIADNGGGVYYDVSNADELANALTEVSTRAFEPFELKGERITGGATIAEATPIEPGQYIDTFANDGRSYANNIKPIYYRVDRSMAGSTLHAGITASLTDGDGRPQSRVRILTEDRDICGLEALQESSDHGLLGIGTNSTARLIRSDDCESVDSLIIEVGQDGLFGGAGLAGQDFELVVYEEPPTTNSDELPASEIATWHDMSAGEPRDDIEPGNSFSSAPIVEPGTYEMSMLPGETKVIAVDADWGQHVQALMEVGPDEKGSFGTGSSARYDLRIFGPYRTLRDRNSVTEGLPDWSEERGDMRFRLGAATPSIRLLNREALYWDGVHDAVIPGPYFIAVTDNQDPDGGNDHLVDYTLTVDVMGEAGAGAPTYDGEGVGGLLGSDTADEPATSGDTNTDIPSDDDETGTDDDAEQPSPGEDQVTTTPPYHDMTTNTASEANGGLSISPGAVILAALGGGALVGGGYMVRQALKRSTA
ncbi:vWA domain-containing protein [Phytoactinopolyspora limicola]|uniref:vWA domain-containing protein n=1 Tax=Phytoactinopolyspora limicola TaxID=2715536 RepID=UPI00140C3503|nr:VWA domain-containing protein [Phytoactinopolyspora limicola]